MDQLLQIMQQRNDDITHLIQNSPIHYKDETINAKYTTINSKDSITSRKLMINKQKQRMNKQNWILKLLKSIKIWNTQIKQDIYIKSQQMMNNLHNSPQLITQNLNIQQNFTQKLINLYVEFHSLFDHSNIKTILRPNNNFIVVDLIKSLIDLHRKKFRQTYIQASTNDYTIQRKIKKVQTFQQTTNPEEQQYKGISYPTVQLQKCQQSKYLHFLKNMNLKEINNQINTRFKALKQANSKNSFIIQRFRQKCLGPKKNLSYNYSNLYTKSQILQLQKKQTKQIKQTYCQSNNIQLKIPQFSLIQKSHNLNHVNKSKIIHQWLPLALNKNVSKQTPFQIVIMKNKTRVKLVDVGQDLDIMAIGIEQWFIKYFQNRIYHTVEKETNQQDIIMSNVIQTNIIQPDNINKLIIQPNPKGQQKQRKKFDKKDFIDFDRKKQFQMLQGDRINYPKQQFMSGLQKNEQIQQQNELKNNKLSTSLKRQPHSQAILPKLASQPIQYHLSTQSSLFLPLIPNKSYANQLISSSLLSKKLLTKQSILEKDMKMYYSKNQFKEVINNYRKKSLGKEWNLQIGNL